MTKRIVRVKRKVYKPPQLPSNPSLYNAICYGRTKSGKAIIPRFILTEMVRNKMWVVVDMETGNIAEGTKLSGYEKEKDAVAKVKKFREQYGKWSTSKF